MSKQISRKEIKLVFKCGLGLWYNLLGKMIWRLQVIKEELLSEIKRLNREDKLTILQLIADELSTEAQDIFEGRSTFMTSPPFHAPEAATTLLNMLKDDRAKDV